MLRKIFFSLMLIVGISLFLVACSGGDNSGDNSGEDTGDDNASASEDDGDQETAEDVELRIVTMFGGTDPATEVLNQALEDFQAEHENVSITNESMTSGDGTFRTKVNTDFSSGNEPDVTYFFTDADAENIIDDGLVVPMDPIMEDNPDWAAGFNENALDQMREEDGKLYAVPTTGFYEGLIVNKKLFEEAGLELPTDWEKYEKAIKTFADEGTIPLAGSMEGSYYLIEHYILAAGGPEGHNATLANGIDDSWVNGLNLIKDHYEMDAFPKDTMTIDDTFAQDLFKQGEAAMMINGSWAVTGLPKDLQENVTVLPMPIPPEGDATYSDMVAGFTSGFYISKKAYDDENKKEAAVELVKSLTSKDMIKEIATANGGTPAADVEIPGLSPAANDGLKAVQEANSLSLPIDSQISPKAFTHIRTNVSQIVTGEKSAEEVLKEAKELE